MPNNYDVKSKVRFYIENKQDVKEKLRVLKLNKIYEDLKDQNYALMEEELYNFCNGSLKRIINFELIRILEYMKNINPDIQMKYRYLDISRMSEMANYDSNSDLDAIFKKIIELELDYGVEIALYSEALKYFFKKINDMDYGFDYDVDYNFDDGENNYLIEINKKGK